MSNTEEKTDRLKVVVVGGGFGGVKAALELVEDRKLDVTLVSDKPDFRYHPTLYRLATGGAKIQSVIPLSDIFSDLPLNLVIKKAGKIDRQNKVLVTEGGPKLNYDKLIIAVGNVTNYFGIKGLEKYSFGIKSPEEATELKEHLHKQLIANKEPDLNYVVVGGGPTGVELAGALPAYLKHIMKMHGMEKQKINIQLVEAAHRVMPSMPKDISASVKRRLKRLGVQVFLNKAVEGETSDRLMVSGKPIRSKTVIWTAGVCNNPFFSNNAFKLTEHGKVDVNSQLQAERDIYVIGDNASTKYSGMAQTAVHDAAFVAENIKREFHGHDIKTYKPKRPVYVTPTGPHWASVLWGKVRLYGRLGWLLRRLADFVAYRDVQTWWKASRSWWAENENEEDCPYCAVESQARA